MNGKISLANLQRRTILENLHLPVFAGGKNVLGVLLRKTR
jgi:hypothetical protein